LGMVYDFLPFMILPLYTTLSKIDNSLYEASADLGGNAFTTFTRITLPLSFPGIASGITMVFLPSMTNYVVSDMLGNSKVTIIGKFIETYFGADWHMGSMIALILLIVVLVSTILTGGFKEEENVRGANL
ncbi:MAG: ABC transporter permease subunit, partial [Clostridiales bacterium]|nr:ABC transporter permease subunit [Clostridiales bacterium]